MRELPEEMDEPEDEETDYLVKSMAHSVEPRLWVEANMEYEPYPELYCFKYTSFSDYSGTYVERSNAKFLRDTFPKLFVMKTGGHGTEWTGISKDDLDLINLEEFEELKKVHTDLENYPVLDDDLQSDMETEAEGEAYNDWIKADFYKELVKAVSERYEDTEEEAEIMAKLEALHDDEDQSPLDGLFWDSYHDSNENFEVEEGGSFYIHLDRVIKEGKAVLKLASMTWPDGPNQTNLPFYDDVVESIVARLMESSISSMLLLEGYDYSCVMANAPDEIAKIVMSWGQMAIPDDILHIDEEDDTKGRENEVHTTVKYGLLEPVPSEELLKIIEETLPFEVTLGKVSLFRQEKYDVVKLGVESKGLRVLNARVSKLENEDKYPD